MGHSGVKFGVIWNNVGATLAVARMTKLVVLGTDSGSLRNHVGDHFEVTFRSLRDHVGVTSEVTVESLLGYVGVNIAPTCRPQTRKHAKHLGI